MDNTYHCWFCQITAVSMRQLTMHVNLMHSRPWDTHFIHFTDSGHDTWTVTIEPLLKEVDKCPRP